MLVGDDKDSIFIGLINCLYNMNRVILLPNEGFKQQMIRSVLLNTLMRQILRHHPCKKIHNMLMTNVFCRWAFSHLQLVSSAPDQLASC